MATWRYRAATSAGNLRSGTVDGASLTEVLANLRRKGLTPIETVETAREAAAKAPTRPNGQARQASINAIGELAVLLEAGLTLDRGLAVCVDNILNPGVKSVFAGLHARIKEGAPLSRAMADARGFFPPMAAAMAEAGEADGRLGAALTRLAESLDRAEALRQTVISSLVYPGMLIVVATSVILVMMLVVVPQFEGLLSDARGKLPFATRAVMAASEGVRHFGLIALAAIVAGGFMLRQWLRRPGVRLSFDRAVLRFPQIGPLIVNAETAAFARTLGSLVDGGVALPSALSIAQRSLGNSHMAAAIGQVAAGLKEGGA